MSRSRRAESEAERAGSEDAARLTRGLRRRGVRDERVLRTMGEVPRDRFVPEELRDFAWEDAPLPIGEGQTISQPLIVALMAEAARVGPDDRVLEVGTGSGYAAAVLGRLAREVFTIERHASLAETAEARLDELGFENVHVRVSDGTRGWPEYAPFDAIVVAAAGPDVPPSLVEQLAPGGRIVIPVGETPREQSLRRLVRSDGQLLDEDLGPVRFVPLVGAEGWPGEAGEAVVSAPRIGGEREPLVSLLREEAEPFDEIETAELGSLVERIGGARIVLIGEATHGTSEFYRMRARITRELIERHGVRIVGIEGDWPDAARLRRWVLAEDDSAGWEPFERFPRWMWRNAETADFLAWLRAWNEGRDPDDRAAVYGLDLYSLYRSADAVVEHLDRVDPALAAAARERYACLQPWQHDPAAYGRAAVSGRYRACEIEVVAMLQDLLRMRLDEVEPWVLDLVENARLVADAERYYRVMYRGGYDSWNLRDGHMMATLRAVLDWHGSDARAAVWAHNSHVGDAAGTEMGAMGQTTLGTLAASEEGVDSYRIGFGTDRGVVAAATDWGGAVEFKALRPSHPESYESLGHRTEVPAFTLHLAEPTRSEVREELLSARLERAVGVVYRPETELRSHYFQASLPVHFDSWIWFDETVAVTPVDDLLERVARR